MIITRTIKSSLSYNLGLVIAIIGSLLMLKTKDSIIIFSILSSITITVSLSLIFMGWIGVRLNNKKIKKASRKFKQLKPDEVRWKVEHRKNPLKPYRLVCDTVYGNFITKGTDILLHIKLFNIYKDEMKNEYYVEVII